MLFRIFVQDWTWNEENEYINAIFYADDFKWALWYFKRLTGYTEDDPWDTLTVNEEKNHATLDCSSSNGGDGLYYKLDPATEEDVKTYLDIIKNGKE